MKKFYRKITMSTIIKATHRHPMPKNAKKELTFMILVTLVPWPVLAYAFPNTGFSTDNMITWMTVFAALTLVLWFIGFRRRSSSQLFAEIDKDRNHIQAWMRRPSSAWSGKLNIANSLNLDEVESAHVEVINGNRTVVVRVKNRSNNFYLPQRLAVQDEVRHFFEDYIDSDEGQKMPNRNLIEKFVSGDEGIVIKDKSTQKDKPKTISDLLADEQAALEKEKAELEEQILNLEKEKGEQ